jgi:hypothetical protein
VLAEALKSRTIRLTGDVCCNVDAALSTQRMQHLHQLGHVDCWHSTSDGIYFSTTQLVIDVYEKKAPL